MKRSFVFSVVVISLAQIPVQADPTIQAIENEKAVTLPKEPQISEHLLEKTASRTTNEDKTKDWGIAIIQRHANVPFAETPVNRVATLNPLMYYQGEHFYLDGLEGGVHFWKTPEWQINGVIRNRYLDLPSEYQNIAGGDSSDFGLQLEMDLKQGLSSTFDFMVDEDLRFHGVMGLHNIIDTADYHLKTSFSARYKSSDFNSYYYGFKDLNPTGNFANIGAGVDISTSIAARYHVYSNLYLLGGASYTYLDANVRHASTIDSSWQGDVYVGFGFFNDKRKHDERTLTTDAYLRIAHGVATPSNTGDILLGDTQRDPHSNQLSSVFYGYPISNELFSLPLDMYLTSGVIWHWRSDVQKSNAEVVAAIKLYYTLEWPVKWRIGLAEGLSYVKDITYIEQKELDEKGYAPSNILNYMDISFDMNAGDLFDKKDWNDVWFGYSLHHRSAIFEKSSQFGRIKGGSNYNTMYLQFKF